MLFLPTTNALATSERAKYYAGCGFKSIIIQSRIDGVRFVNDSGFDTIAYTKDWFLETFKTMDLKCNCTLFGKIGIGFYNF